MTHHWWYRAFGEEFGPFDLMTIQELHDAGTLNGSDEIRKGKQGTWCRLDSIVADSSDFNSPSPSQENGAPTSWTSLDDIRLGQSSSPAVSGDFYVAPAKSPNPQAAPATNEESDSWSSLDELPVSQTSDSTSDLLESNESLPSTPPSSSPRNATNEPSSGGSASQDAVSGEQERNLAESDVPQVSASRANSKGQKYTDGTNDPQDYGPTSQLSSAIIEATQNAVAKDRGRHGKRPQQKASPRATGLIERTFTEAINSASIVAEIGGRTLKPISSMANGIRENWLVACTILVICIVAVVAVVLPDYWWTTQSVHEEVARIHETILRMQQDNATEQQWSDFEEQATTSVELIVERLSPSAGSDNPARLNLLRAARDCIPKILREPGTASTESEQRLAALLRNSEQSLRRQSNTTPLSGDWLTYAIVGADMLVLALAATWYFSRRN